MGLTPRAGLGDREGEQWCWASVKHGWVQPALAPDVAVCWAGGARSAPALWAVVFVAEGGRLGEAGQAFEASRGTVGRGRM